MRLFSCSFLWLLVFRVACTTSSVLVLQSGPSVLLLSSTHSPISPLDRSQTLTPLGESPSVWFLEGTTLVPSSARFPNAPPKVVPLLHSIIGVGAPATIRSVLSELMSSLRPPASSPVSLSRQSSSSVSSSSSSQGGVAPPLEAVSHTELCRRLALALRQEPASRQQPGLSFAVVSVESGDDDDQDDDDENESHHRFVGVSSVDCAGAVRPASRLHRGSSSSDNSSSSADCTTSLHLGFGLPPSVRRWRAGRGGGGGGGGGSVSQQDELERRAVGSFRARSEREANAGGQIVMYVMSAGRGGEVTRKVFSRNNRRTTTTEKLYTPRREHDRVAEGGTVLGENAAAL